MSALSVCFVCFVVVVCVCCRVLFQSRLKATLSDWSGVCPVSFWFDLSGAEHGGGAPAPGIEGRRETTII